MKKEIPTLFDRVRMAALNDDTALHDAAELRQKIFSARRFTLDNRMSTFLSDLSRTAFMTGYKGAQPALKKRDIEFMRMSARLPHKITWIEYDLRECIKRGWETVPPEDGKFDLTEIPKTEGWLIEQHPQIETAFRASVFLYDDNKAAEYETYEFPWVYVWITDDNPLPYKVVKTDENPWGMSDVCVGLQGYKSTQVGVIPSRVVVRHEETWKFLATLLKEWCGVVRRMWALLATINDLPVEFKEVKASRGFMAKRNYHKFLDHKVITLSVPQAQYVKIARNAVAKARRRAHMVRGHWRNNYRAPGQRVWVHEHQRGDASLGFVTHDYNVERSKERQA